MTFVGLLNRTATVYDGAEYVDADGIVRPDAPAVATDVACRVIRRGDGRSALGRPVLRAEDGTVLVDHDVMYEPIAGVTVDTGYVFVVDDQRYDVTDPPREARAAGPAIHHLTAPARLVRV